MKKDFVSETLSSNYNDRRQPPTDKTMLTNDHEAAMPETTMQAAGALASIWNFISGFIASISLTAKAVGLGAGLAAVVVMCMTQPRTKREWAVSLISTVAGSIGGGAYVVIKFELLKNVDTMFDAMALFGIVFACGLPAWAIIRAVFNYLEKHKEKDIAELYRGVKEIL